MDNEFNFIKEIRQQPRVITQTLQEYGLSAKDYLHQHAGRLG